MKKTYTRNLHPNMVTAEDIYTYNNQLILPKGTMLTDKSITMLEFYSIYSIYVEENEDVLLKSDESVVEEITGIKKEKEYREYQKRFERAVDNFKDSVNDIVIKNTPVNPDSLLKNMMELINSKHGKVNIFSMLNHMRKYDDSTYTHCLNVALVSHVFAGWLNYSEDDINTATLCGLLHDIGKLMIPDTIIKKTDKLTDQEYDIVKTHTIEGYNILKKSPISEHIMNAALMHHERSDGSGYPMGITAKQIDPFASLVAIADVYDAMTSARVYRGPLCPFQVIDIYVSEGLQKYNTKAILTFMNNIATTYLGTNVRLSNGIEGKIVYINPNNLARPTIKAGEKYIDLSKETGLSIEDLF